MKHELTQCKCFVPDTPSFYDHTWVFKQDDALALQCVIGYATSLYLVMNSFNKSALSNKCDLPSVLLL